jgi:multicomponent Na+:H+ antiporter subunit E
MRAIVAVAAGRAALFLAFWLMIAGYDAADLPVGVITALAATWASLKLIPATAVRLRFLPLVRFVLHFLRQSAVSGVEVAALVFNPKMPLRPGFITFPCRLRTAGARSAFCAISSLLPGTLPTGSDEAGGLVIHCLDVDKPVAAGLAVEEAFVTRILGHE